MFFYNNCPLTMPHLDPASQFSLPVPVWSTIAALAAHNNVPEVITFVHVKGGARKVTPVAALLMALRHTRDSVSVPGCVNVPPLLGAHKEGRVGNN